ncbi:DUF3298 and DUF4163 domain-containing protein [Algibacter sp. R77976]|uniref:DUF3298 and DUF4163 domain-containing protein n=1 Tax=Algibacter sp. R77976 TaxID=3093873 RepID=UPI0037C63564
MKFKHSLLLLTCILVFINCKVEQKTVFSEINISTESNTIVEVNIPEASGNETVSNQINSHIQKLVITALHIGNPDEITSTSVEKSIDSFNNEFNAFKNDFPESSQLWEAQIDGEVMYQSSEVISIAITTYTNTGGAHGVLNISFLNFNPETGEKIENNQLFNNIKALKKIAESHYIDSSKDKSLILDSEEFKLPENIGYSEDGIVFLYNTYEIAPYAKRIIEFAIPYEAIESYLVFNSL